MLRNRSLSVGVILCLLILCSPCYADERTQSPSLWKFDFGMSKTEAGYTVVNHQATYTPERGYGWLSPVEHIRERSAPASAILRDHVFGLSDATFRVKLENGLYRMTLISGDIDWGNHFTQPVVDGSGLTFPVLNPAKGDFATLKATLNITNEFLNLKITSPSNNWVLNSLVLERVESPEEVEVTKKSYLKKNNFCPRETDPHSLTYSKLKGDLIHSKEIVRLDVDQDGDPDVLERWWNGKRTRWFDENDNMKSIDIMGDCIDDFLQVDYDGDKFYDGPSDMSIDWVDDDGDGDADLQIIGINPRPDQPSPHGGASHHMIFVDVDDDNVHGYINWSTWDPFHGACWRFTGKGNFSPDYNGDAIFLKVHYPPFLIADPRYNWENPFAFYDFDDDGCTEMAIRHCDSPVTKIIDGKPIVVYDGELEEAFVTMDLDNDSQKGNEMDYDMSLRFSEGKKLNYHRFVNKHPKMKVPAWVEPYMRFSDWRQIEELIYVPHAKCYKETFKPEWGNIYFVFDEDDDDHRWERVEIYYPGEVYSTARWGSGGKRALPGHPQSDRLGDRGEYDEDASGKGKLYIGPWDMKIHLYGAEWGAWLVDYHVKYWGSWPVTGDSSPDGTDKVEEVVQYKDTNGNGFIDYISYDYDGDRTQDLEVSLLDYATVKNPEPDVCPIINTVKEKWQGMHEIFIEIAEKSWQDALKIYRAAWEKGLTDAELDDLAISASTNEKYRHAYWLKEKVLRNLLSQADSGRKKEILKIYFTGQFKALADYIRNHEWSNPKEEKDVMNVDEIKQVMKRVFQYQTQNLTSVANAAWERGALYTGIMAAYRETQDEDYLTQAMKWSEENNWEFCKNRLGYWFADNQTCGQTYLDLYLLKGGEEKIAHARKIIDEMIANPPRGRDEWWWCDALYMAPATFARLAVATGEDKYVDLMNEMWWDTTDFLYDQEEHLYYRDKNYFNLRTKNGKKVFWSRGNGWVIAGIAQVLDFLPEDHPRRKDFITLYRQMADALIQVQGEDGLWRMSLLDAEEHPLPETSGTGFFTFAILAGINDGILDRDQYFPVVEKAWKGLVQCVFNSGKLGYVQLPAGSPTQVSPDTTHEYGSGAFLLAGSEMLKLQIMDKGK